MPKKFSIFCNVLLQSLTSVSHPSLTKFDALLRRSIQRITNSDLSHSRGSRLICQSEMVAGSMTCLRLHLLLLAASTVPQDDILTDCNKSNNKPFQTYLSAWSAKYVDISDALHQQQQPFWDRRTPI